MFKELSQMLADGQMLALTIMKCGNRLSVAVLPQNEQVTDPAKNLIVPLTVTGTPEELDSGFIGSIAQPITSANGMLTGMAEFDKALEKTNKEAKATKDKIAQGSKLIKEAEELEKNDKLPEALVVYKKALEVDGSNQKVKIKIGELTSSLAQIDLFAEDVKAATQLVQQVEKEVSKPQQTQIYEPEVPLIPEPEPLPQKDMFAELMGMTENKPAVIPEHVPLPSVASELVQTPGIDMDQYRKFLEFQKFQESFA